MFLFRYRIPWITCYNWYSFYRGGFVTYACVSFNRQPSSGFGIFDSLLTFRRRCLVIFVYIYILLGFLITLISYSNYFNLIEFDLLLGFPGLSDNFFIYFNLCYVYSLIFYVIYNKRAFIFTFLDKFRLIVYIIQTYPVTSIKFLIYVLFFYYRIQNDISIDNILLMNSGGGGSGSGLPPHNGGNNPLPPGGGNNPLPPEGERLRILPANNPINTSASLDLIKTKVQWRWDHCPRQWSIYRYVETQEGGFNCNFTREESDLLANLVRNEGLEASRPFAVLRYLDMENATYNRYRVVRLTEGFDYPIRWGESLNAPRIGELRNVPRIVETRHAPVRPSLEFRTYLNTLNQP